MDYKKAYNEAIERARQFMSEHPTRAEADLMVALFPELKESEDERIREFLIDLLSHGTWKKDWPFSPAECVAWLEKQKEQIPYTDFVIKPHKGDDNNPYDMRESEAQEYTTKRGFDIPFNDGEVFVDERYITQTIGNILRWADEHPKEQKPTEWAELQSEFRSINEAFEDGKKEVVAHPEKYGLCKPAEWSESDDEMLEYVIYDVNDAKQLFATKEAIELCDKEIAWLKSLPLRCPKSTDNWKPSEEQEEPEYYQHFDPDC